MPEEGKKGCFPVVTIYISLLEMNLLKTAFSAFKRELGNGLDITLSDMGSVLSPSGFLPLCSDNLYIFHPPIRADYMSSIRADATLTMPLNWAFV